MELAKNNDLSAFDSAQDPFWTPLEIDESRWDESYPFQLILLKVNKAGGYDRAPGQSTFTLPIPPSALQGDMPFNMRLGVTQGGVSENNNGARLRPIILQGTTGVLPGRSVATSRTTPSIGGIFAGTIRQTQNLANTVQSFGNASTVFKPNVIKDLPGTSMAKTSGYYQFLMLQNWLEAYAVLRASPQGADYRLAFAYWKTKQVWLVTPQRFSWRKNAASPHKFEFTLHLLGWRRYDPDAPPPALAVNPNGLPDANQLKQFLSKIDGIQTIIHGAGDVLTAVRGDINQLVFEPLRQAALCVKDALGVAIQLADLPVQVVSDMKDTIIEAAAIGTLFGQAGQAFGSVGSRINSRLQQVQDQLKDLTVSSGHAETQTGTGYGLASLSALNASPAIKVLENPEDNYDFFSQIRVGNLNLRPATVKKIADERQRVRQLKRADFEGMRDQLKTFLLDFSDAVGTGSSTYNAMFGRPAPTVTRQTTDAEFQVMFALGNAIQELGRLATSEDASGNQRVTAMEYIAGLARDSGIPFQVPASEQLVPFPYGSTLEQLAQRYLGDTGRWPEIATLNRLRSPYVDEVGFDLPLLTNGNGNQVTVADASNLFVGQSVWIGSNQTAASRRRITGLQPIGSAYVLVTVDGDADLSKYKRLAGALLHAFLPDTVNSQMLVAIPSSAPADAPVIDGKSISGLDTADNWLRIAGVDLLMTPSGDAAITPDGDWPLAIGLQNAVQRARTFFSTPLGSLPNWRGYGLRIKPGQTAADMSAEDILDAARSISAYDTMFTGIQSAAVAKKANTLTLAVSLGVKNSSRLLPVSFEIPR